MTVLELIDSLQQIADEGYGDNHVVYKDELRYYNLIERGAVKCDYSHGDYWNDDMNDEDRVPHFVFTREDFNNLIIIE